MVAEEIGQTSGRTNHPLPDIKSPRSPRLRVNPNLFAEFRPHPPPVFPSIRVHPCPSVSIRGSSRLWFWPERGIGPTRPEDSHAEVAEEIGRTSGRTNHPLPDIKSPRSPRLRVNPNLLAEFRPSPSPGFPCHPCQSVPSVVLQGSGFGRNAGLAPPGPKILTRRRGGRGGDWADLRANQSSTL